MSSYRVQTNGGGTTGTGDRTAVMNAQGTNDLLVVFCHAAGNTNTAPVCSDTGSDGGTYTLVGTAFSNSSADTFSVFVRDKGCPSTASLTITVATGANDSAEIVIIAVQSITRYGINVVRSSGFQANQAGGTTPAPTLNQAALTGNMTLTAVGAHGTGGQNGNSNASWSNRVDIGQLTPTIGVEVATRDSGFTGTTITYAGTTATSFASVALELDAGSLADVPRMPAQRDLRSNAIYSM